jgi:hypothetical protein
MKIIYLTLVVGLFLVPTILVSQTVSISGQITRHNGDPVPDIEVGCIETATTDAEGNFEIPDVPLNTICDITGIGVFDKFEEVTILDVLVIQRFIVQFNSNINGYQILACDVNNTQSITTLDMVKAMQLGLHMDIITQDNWGCIDADYIFSNPFTSGPTSISVNATDTITGVDFVAVKRGDPAISSDYMPAPAGAPSPTFFISNESFPIGDDVEYEVTVEDFSNIIGFQHTFKWDPDVLTFESAEGFSGVNVELNDDFVNQGLLPTLSIRSDAPIQDGDVVMKLNFTALSDVSNPMEVVSFSDEIIQKQVVWQNTVGIDLFIVDGEYEYGETPTAIVNAPVGLESFQVFPNPVENDLHVKALLRNAEDFEISIVNLLGQKVYSEKFDQKELLLNIGFGEFPAGTYFLSLKTADGIHTESLIKK